MTRSSANLVNADSPCLTAEGWERLARQAEYSLAKMASLLRLSLRHLERIFKNELHCTPTRWLRELRCRQAKRLIVQGYSTKAAAAALKYVSSAHFCRDFKRVFGVSPQCFAPK